MIDDTNDNIFFHTHYYNKRNLLQYYLNNETNKKKENSPNGTRYIQYTGMEETLTRRPDGRKTTSQVSKIVIHCKHLKIEKIIISLFKLFKKI